MVIDVDMVVQPFIDNGSTISVSQCFTVVVVDQSVGQQVSSVCHLPWRNQPGILQMVCENTLMFRLLLRPHCDQSPDG